ncbi:hypothetical protein AOLI_G00092930 [Acnodon oligacanthus]
MSSIRDSVSGMVDGCGSGRALMRAAVTALTPIWVELDAAGCGKLYHSPEKPWQWGHGPRTELGVLTSEEQVHHAVCSGVTVCMPKDFADHDLTEISSTETSAEHAVELE